MSAPDVLRLPVSSPALRGVLEAGVTTIDGESIPVVPQGIDRDEVVFHRVDRSAERPPPLALWWRAIRPISLTATATPALAIWIYGVRRGETASLGIAIAALVGALLLQLAVNLFNDAEDHLRLIDLPGGPGGAGVLQRGWLTATEVRRGAIAALLLGIAAGVPALLRAPLPILAIGALGVLGAIGYSGRPFGFKYRALGDLAVLVLCGPGMTLGMSYAAFGHASLGAWLIGGYFGLLAVAILHANNLDDRELDRSRGAITLAQALGDRGGRLFFICLYAGAFALPPIAWHLGLLHPIPAFVPLAVGVPFALRRPHRLHAAQAHLLLGVIFTLALLATR